MLRNLFSKKHRKLKSILCVALCLMLFGSLVTSTNVGATENVTGEVSAVSVEEDAAVTSEETEEAEAEEETEASETVEETEDAAGDETATADEEAAGTGDSLEDVQNLNDSLSEVKDITDTSAYDSYVAQLADLETQVVSAIEAGDMEAANTVYASIQTILDELDAALADGTLTEEEYGKLYNIACDISDSVSGVNLAADDLPADALTDESLLWSTLTNPEEDESGDVTLTVVTTKGETETYQYANIMDAVKKLFSYMNHGDNYQTKTSYSANTAWYYPNRRGYNWSDVDYTWDYESAVISFTEEHREYITTSVQFKSATSGWQYASLNNVTFDGNGTGSIVGDPAQSWTGDVVVSGGTYGNAYGYGSYSNLKGTITISGDNCTIKNTSFKGNHTWAFTYYTQDNAIGVGSGVSGLTIENNSFEGYTLVTAFGQSEGTVTDEVFTDNTVANCLFLFHTADGGATNLTVTNNTLTGSAEYTLASCMAYTTIADFSGNTLNYASFGLQNCETDMTQFLTKNTYDHGFIYQETVDYSWTDEKLGTGTYYYLPSSTTVMTVLPEDTLAVWTSDYDMAGEMDSSLTYTQQDAVNDGCEAAEDKTYAAITWTGGGTDENGNVLDGGVAIGYNYTAMHLDYADAGSLTVEKNIVYGNSSKEFTFTVEIDTSTCSKNVIVGGVYGKVVDADGNGSDEVEFTVDAANAEKSKATFTLSDGESVTLKNLPVDATYTVTEASAANYTATIKATDEKAGVDGTSVTGKVISDGTTISYTNTYSSPGSSGSGEDFDVSKSKEATNLDENYESDVTISLPSASYAGDLDVVFVLDGSTSTDETELATQAAELLESLLGYENLNVKAGVVIFGGSVPVLYNSDLLALDETNCKKLTSELTDTDYNIKDEGHKGYGRSGSNLQAGVEAARTLLNGDTDVDSADKYMIILTDGGARMWYDSESGEAMSDGYAYSTSVWWNSNEDWCNRYGKTGSESYVSEAAPTFESVWAEGQNGASIGKYGLTYSQWQAAVAGDTSISYASWDTAMHADDYYTTYEAACYYAATSIVAASQEVNVCMVTYPYYSNTTYTTFTEEFKTWLESYVTRYDSSEADAETIFAAVEDQLIQLVDAGSVVVDEIGDTGDYDFDFINNIDRLTLTVDGETMTVTQINENTYGFGDANGSSDGTTYPFVLTYYPDGTTYSGTAYNECYVLAINVPITKNKAVKLTYGVVLTNPQTEAGTYGTYDQYGDNNDGSESYGLYTNNVARLYPVDSNGNSLPPEDFQKPTVSYTVTDDTTVIPKEDEPDEDTGKTNTGSEVTDTATDTTTNTTSSSASAKTGDTNTAIYWILIAAAACVVVFTVSGKRKHS